MSQAVVFDYEQFAPRVEAALREVFPLDTIATSEGYQGRVHVKIVSSRFNGMSEREKQNFVWEVLRERLGEDAQVVSFVVAYGTDEL